jgi:hypothetical protein
LPLICTTKKPIHDEPVVPIQRDHAPTLAMRYLHELHKTTTKYPYSASNSQLFAGFVKYMADLALVEKIAGTYDYEIFGREVHQIFPSQRINSGTLPKAVYGIMIPSRAEFGAKLGL